MGLIPRETQNNINIAIRILYSIDKSLGRIADALEKQNEAAFVEHYTELGPIAEVRTAEWHDDHNE